MKNRDFETWFSTFKPSIANYAYYVDFDTVFNHVNNIKVELNILNTLIASKNIEEDFKHILTHYPQTLQCIPILLAVRSHEIKALDHKGPFVYDFSIMRHSIDQYAYFMRETGLFDLLENHLINNLFDYVTGVEAGLSSNGRKNRGGHLMENLVENYIKELNVIYYKEMTAKKIESTWNLNLSSIINDGRSSKRFDFVIELEGHVYVIETNFYGTQGSKLNETARSYKSLALGSKTIENLTFVWITDGQGWKSAKKNLLETFEIMDHIYNLNDLDNGALETLISNSEN